MAGGYKGASDAYGSAYQFGMVPTAFAMPAYGFVPAQAYGYQFGYYGAYNVQNSASGSAFSIGSAPSGYGMNRQHDSQPGRPGDTKSLLEELKAKQAAREEQKRLREQIRDCNEDDFETQGKLQSRLNSVEHGLWLMGDTADVGCFGASSLSRERRISLRPPEDGSVDQFGRFCHVLVQFLRSCEGTGCLLSRAMGERSVRQEWDDLVQSKVVDRSVGVAQLLAARSNVFEVHDRGGEAAVRLAKDSEFRNTRSASGSSGSDRSGDGLSPETVAAVEAHMKKAGGSEQVSRLERMFGLKRSQLSKHFTLYEDSRRLYAMPGLGQGPGRPVPNGIEEQREALRELEGMLRSLTPSRPLIGEAMAFCMDHGEHHGAHLSRALVRALEEKALSTDAAIARLFLVSDVLYNSNSGAKGASRYRTSFQDLLPDACECLGRQWLQRPEHGKLERERAGAAAHRVLDAWRDWAVFPPLFVNGLEALLFAPVGEDAEAEMAEADAPLRRRMARWAKESEASRLPYAARLRGLSGSALPRAACLARLCHYERYWYVPGEDDFEQAGAEAAAGGDVQFAADVKACAEGEDGQTGEVEAAGPGCPDLDGAALEPEDMDGESLSDVEGALDVDEEDIPQATADPSATLGGGALLAREPSRDGWVAV